MPDQLHQLRGEALLSLIALTRHPIKLFRAGDTRPRLKINAHQAAILLKGGVFEGGGSKHRCRYIREIDTRTMAPWTECWRTAGACVMQPHSLCG